MTPAVTPCRAKPAGWDLPTLDTLDDGRLQADVATQAVAGCAACPMLRPCARAAAQSPPNHDCIQAGRVYWRRQVYSLDAFIALVRNRDQRRQHDERSLKPCGTPAAAKRHWSRGEPACPACRSAVRERDRRTRLLRAKAAA